MMKDDLSRKEAELLLLETTNVSKPNKKLLKFFFQISKPSHNRYLPIYTIEEMKKIAEKSNISKFAKKYYKQKKEKKIMEMEKTEKKAYEELFLAIDS